MTKLNTDASLLQSCVSGSIFDVSEEEMTQNCMIAAESSFKKEWDLSHTAKCMYKLKDIPNIEGFELIAVFEDNSTLKVKVEKNKNGQYFIPSFIKMTGWYSVSEYYR